MIIRFGMFGGFEGLTQPRWGSTAATRRSVCVAAVEPQRGCVGRDTYLTDHLTK